MTFNQFCGKYGVCPHLTTSIVQNTAAVLMGSAPSLLRTRANQDFPKVYLKYCTQYVPKSAKLQCAIQIICGSEIQWIPPGSSQGV